MLHNVTFPLFLRNDSISLSLFIEYKYKIAAFSLKLYQTNIPVENFATISSICILMPPYKPNAFKAIIL